MPRTHLLGVAVMFSATVLGCTGDGDGDQQNTHRTPRDVLAEMHSALLQGDRERFLSTFRGPQDYMEFVGVVFDHMRLGYQFEDAVVKAYGPDSWDKYQAGRGIHIDTLTRNKRWAQDLQIRTSDDRQATAFLGPSAGFPVRLFEEKGRWYIDAISMLPPNADPKHIGRLLRANGEAVAEVLPRVQAGHLSFGEFEDLMEKKAAEAFSKWEGPE